MPKPKIDRRCHWLRPNTKSRRPDAIVFVDVESHMTPLDEKRTEHTLRLGWAVLANYSADDGLVESEWYQIDDAPDFWLWVAKIAVDHGQVYVVAHNIAYDARILKAFSILPALSFAPDYAIMGESCTFFTFKSDDTEIHLLDNSNYWQVSLDQLGAEFGIEKGKVDFDTVGDDELSAYCKRDVQILVKVWQYWLSALDDHDLGDFAVTTAGQSWNAYRHRFLHAEIGIHNRRDAIDLERASYKGGRVEVFRVGKFNTQNYYKLDCNGLYAYCMAEYPHPTKLVKVVKNRTPSELTHLLDDYLCIADCIVETDKPYYPTQLGGQNAFPLGTFRTQLTTPELRLALFENHLRAIGQIALYEPGDLFSDFIGTLTPLRQQYKEQGNTGRSLIFKLLRNSLYGKFAQKGYKQEVIGDAPLDAVECRRWVNSESGERCVDWVFGGVKLRQYYIGESLNSFPAISAHTAAYARAHMLSLLELALVENCFYMDTDSLIVSEKGFERLGLTIDSLKLGHLKVESVSNRLEIRAKKSYTLGDQTVTKGIKKNAIALGNNTFQQWHFTTLNFAFRNGSLDNVLTYQVEKHLTNTIKAGLVRKDGTVIPPWLTMRQEQAYSIVAPESRFNYTWWVNVNWLASLSQPQPQFDAEMWRWPFASPQPTS